LKRCEELEVHAGTTFETTSTLDDLVSAMQDAVKEQDTNLIVMGTKGASNYESKVFGSNAINVMEHIDQCPILCVPLDAEPSSIKEIVLPTDYHIRYRQEHLDALIRLMKASDAGIRILHVADEEELNKNEQANKTYLEKKFMDTPHSFHHLSGRNVNETVKHFIDSRESDMMAFGNKRHTFISRLFSTNMTMEFGMFSKIPLFVMTGE
jgi:nucleotide-binding universal stress UspA family protein